MGAPVRIGIVAGEASGDALGAELISHLRERYPEALFAGVGGDRMSARGFNSLVDIERLSVMGLVDPLKRLPELLRIRRRLFRHLLHWPADLVVGIDSPDFNLGLEHRLRREGILTAHYVSPSVWAWRQGRIKKIARAVDQMLTLFPFEAAFYEQHGVPVAYVGHPLADSIPVEVDQAAARRELGLGQGLLLAVMPGSRAGEVKAMANLFLQACLRLGAENTRLDFVIPAANPARYRELQEILLAYRDLPVTLTEGDSHRVMAASDAVLLTSGTTALEAMLLKKPMVVSYRMGELSYRLLSRLVKTPFIALPNLIAGRELVPELVQSKATVDNLVAETRVMLYDAERRKQLRSEFTAIHESLRRNAGREAAATLADLIESRKMRGKG